MYAVIKTGGKQYTVATGEKIKIEQIPADIGSKITFKEVMMIADGENVVIGKPYVEGAKVTASVVSVGRHEKIRIFKLRRRKHYQRHMGHRQNYIEVSIDIINNK